MDLSTTVSGFGAGGDDEEESEEEENVQVEIQEEITMPKTPDWEKQHVDPNGSRRLAKGEWKYIVKELARQGIGVQDGEWQLKDILVSQEENGIFRNLMRWACAQNNTIQDMMVIKKIHFKNRGGSDAPPTIDEAVIHRYLTVQGSRSILPCRGYSLWGDDDKVQYLYLDWAPYGNLESLLDAHRRGRKQFPEPFLWLVFKALADAVHAMNTGRNYDRRSAEEYERWTKEQSPEEQEQGGSKQIAHLDLHPGNVFLGAKPGGDYAYYPQPLVADFGLSEEIKDKNYPSRGRGVGGWQAPEMTPLDWRPNNPDQNPGNWPIGFHTDIFVIGLVMWELLRCPRGNIRSYNMQYNRADTLPLREPTVRGTLPPFSRRLHTLVNRCLRWHWRRRIQLDDLCEDIEQGLASCLSFYGDFRTRTDLRKGFAIIGLKADDDDFRRGAPAPGPNPEEASEDSLEASENAPEPSPRSSRATSLEKEVGMMTRLPNGKMERVEWSDRRKLKRIDNLTWEYRPKYLPKKDRAMKTTRDRDTGLISDRPRKRRKTY